MSTIGHAGLHRTTRMRRPRPDKSTPSVIKSSLIGVESVDECSPSCGPLGAATACCPRCLQAACNEAQGCSWTRGVPRLVRCSRSLTAIAPA